MKLSLQVINLFEHLATNIHSNVVIDELIANQSDEVKEILSSKSSENLKKQFSKTGYFADSVKVTEI